MDVIGSTETMCDWRFKSVSLCLLYVFSRCIWQLRNLVFKFLHFWKTEPCIFFLYQNSTTDFSACYQAKSHGSLRVLEIQSPTNEPTQHAAYSAVKPNRLLASTLVSTTRRFSFPVRSGPTTFLGRRGDCAGRVLVRNRNRSID